jgi:hypothetical protein
MQEDEKRRFLDLVLREPSVAVTRQRAAELALQAGYTEWPGFRPALAGKSDRAPMAVVTAPTQLQRVGASHERATS